MGYLTYRGPADVVLTIDAGDVDLPGLMVLFQQTHTAVFELLFPDHPERERCSAVKVTLPDGYTECGSSLTPNTGSWCFAPWITGTCLENGCEPPRNRVTCQSTRRNAEIARGNSQVDEIKVFGPLAMVVALNKGGY